MNCPSCGKRYPADALSCRRCGITLAPDPPEGSPGGISGTDPGDLVPVCRLSHPAEIPVVKSLLESEGIPYLLQGEHSMALEPIGGLLGGGRGEIGALLLVTRRHEDEVRDLLDSTVDVEPFEGTGDDD